MFKKSYTFFLAYQVLNLNPQTQSPLATEIPLETSTFWPIYDAIPDSPDSDLDGLKITDPDISLTDPIKSPDKINNRLSVVPEEPGLVDPDDIFTSIEKSLEESINSLTDVLDISPDPPSYNGSVPSYHSSAKLGQAPPLYRTESGLSEILPCDNRLTNQSSQTDITVHKT